MEDREFVQSRSRLRHAFSKSTLQLYGGRCRGGPFYHPPERTFRKLLLFFSMNKTIIEWKWGMPLCVYDDLFHLNNDSPCRESTGDALYLSFARCVVSRPIFCSSPRVAAGRFSLRPPRRRRRWCELATTQLSLSPERTLPCPACPALPCPLSFPFLSFPASLFLHRHHHYHRHHHPPHSAPPHHRK